jgi:hypothetical protein
VSGVGARIVCVLKQLKRISTGVVVPNAILAASSILDVVQGLSPYEFVALARVAE